MSSRAANEIPMRILVLEDDDAFREMLEDALTDQGYEVCSVGRGEKAVRMAQEEPFDLVVTDIRMEGIDGLEALERVKGHIPDIGSLVITGYSTEEDSIRAIRLGVGDYLKKPFRLSAFVDSVETILERRRQERVLSFRESALRKTALWTVESLARSVGLGLSDDQIPPEGLLAAGQWAQRLAQELALTAEHAVDVRLATLVAVIRNQAADLCPEFLVDGLSDQVRRILRHATERWDGGGAPDGLAGDSIPLGSRVAALVVSLVRDCPQVICREAPDTSLPVDFGTADPGAFDPRVLEVAARSLRADASPGTGGSPGSELSRQRRGLLSLGLALEQQGDLDSARSAFSEILADGRITREGVEAHLGLARTGAAEEVRTRAAEAYRWAQQLGPTATARTGLQSGLLLLRHDLPEGPSLLQRTADLLSELGMSSEEAVARLALARYGLSEQSVEIPLKNLFRPQAISELMDSLDWLLPYLLERQCAQPEPALQSALGRIASEFPRRLRRTLLTGDLSLEARKAAVVVLAAGGPSAEATLRGLMSDPSPEIQRGAARAIERLRDTEAPLLLRIYSLGGFEVYRGEEAIEDWKSQKVRYLLACLAARRGPVSEDLLIDEFWPENPQRGKPNLYAATSHLRRHLRPEEGAAPGLDPVLRTPAGLSLNQELPRWHDLDELERRLERSRTEQDSEHALADGRAIAQLYRGPYLEGCYMDWAIAAQNRIEKQVLDALLELVELTYRLERFGETIEYGRRVLEIDPCCQQAHLLVMRALTATGRPEEAIRQFEDCQKILKREMAMEPSIEMLEVHQRALLSID